MPAFVGFAPDVDPRTPGIFTEMSGMYPTMKGWRPIPTMDDLSNAANGAIRGGIVARFLDGTIKIYVGTSSKLYRLDGNTLTDVSGGSVFNLGTDDRWRFAVYGNHVIATWRSGSSTDVVQVANGPAANFANLAGSPPRASIVAIASEFVFLLNTNTATNQWWCSGIGDDTAWTPDIATQSANGILAQTPGPIIGARNLGPDLILYKPDSCYIGRYVGPPIIWSFELLSASVGAQSHESVVHLGDRHVFPGPRDFYTIDGGRPQPIPSQLREYFFSGDFGAFDRDLGFRTMGRWDKERDLVVWTFPVTSEIYTELYWHLPTNRWASDSIEDIEFVLPDTYIVDEGGIYESPIFAGTDHKLYDLTGGGVKDVNFTTGWFGDPMKFTQLQRVKPYFSIAPTRKSLLLNSYSVGLEHRFTNNNTPATTLGGGYEFDVGYNSQLSLSVDFPTTYGPWAQEMWFNLLGSARYHVFSFFSTNTDWELVELEPIFRSAGKH